MAHEQMDEMQKSEEKLRNDAHTRRTLGRAALVASGVSTLLLAGGAVFAEIHGTNIIGSLEEILWEGSALLADVALFGWGLVGLKAAGIQDGRADAIAAQQPPQEVL